MARAPREPSRRLAPALGAARRRQGRTLGVRPRGDPKARDDVDRDHARRRERLRRRLDGRSELRRPRPLPARRPRGAKAALGLPADRPVVSYFGFIYPSKGFREFIEAAARLRDRGLDASYLIVGGAVRGEEFFRTLVGRSLQLADLTRNYESEAKQLVDELGLTELFRFVPFTQDTANLYQASDVVVAPSQGPELGRPVIEAAASGVPVVASGSRTGGGVVVPGETGVLVDNFGVETLADAVAELLAEPDRRERFGRRARAHAEQNFDPAKNARRIEGDLPPASRRSASASRCSTSTIARSSAVRRRHSRS